jgi:outer membrane protein insertion porin family
MIQIRKFAVPCLSGIFILLCIAIPFSLTAQTDLDEINVVHEQEFNETHTHDDTSFDAAQSDESEEGEAHQNVPVSHNQPHYIHTIFIKGHNTVPESAIRSRLPYRPGELFDPLKARDLIQRLYYDLRRFKNISVFIEPLEQNQVNVHVVVEEKTPVKDIQFEGNANLPEKEIYEKIPLADMPALDPQELQAISCKIKKLYTEKGYHAVDINTEFLVDETNRATVRFIINEKPKSLIKRIEFRGNYAINSKELRAALYSKEDWLLSFLDKSGTFQEERLEADRHMIEQLYQNRGYVTAKVLDVLVDLDEAANSFFITFVIQEGERYHVKEVTLPDIPTIIPRDVILKFLPLQAGTIYSRQAVMDSIKDLETLWGDQGYIFAQIEPSIIPDPDNKTVSVAFQIEPGEKVFLNRIRIIGNKKSRDKVIRRQIFLEEGGILTNSGMESSKSRVQSLGYFDVRDGVNWKVTRLNDNLADLDLMVKEVNTGNASFQLGYGGTQSITSPSDGITGELNISDTNLFGTGIRMNALGRLSKDERTVIVNATEPWLFDKPIYLSFDAYQKRVSYEEEFRHTPAINEKVTGGLVSSGFNVNWAIPSFTYFVDTFFRASVGIENIEHPHRVPFTQAQRDILELEDRWNYFNVLRNELFVDGFFTWLTFALTQDKKNHPMHPSRGQAWTVFSQFAFPILSRIGFVKLDLDYHWFTPLIGDFDLIFHFHTHLGFVMNLRNYAIPYRELYKIGGTATVRGFTFGQISPRFSPNTRRDHNSPGDAIGGAYAFWINAELIFPINPDMSMKGVFFYDGGAGWDNPYAAQMGGIVKNNNFDYRHAVGVGIRMLNPMPIRVDCGFKLDPRKREPAYEVHFGMVYDWA